MKIAFVNNAAVCSGCEDHLLDLAPWMREHNILPVYYTSRLIRPLRKKKPKMVAVFHTPTGRYYPGLRGFDGIIATSDYTGGATAWDSREGRSRKTTSPSTRWGEATSGITRTSSPAGWGPGNPDPSEL